MAKLEQLVSHNMLKRMYRQMALYTCIAYTFQISGTNFNKIRKRNNPVPLSTVPGLRSLILRLLTKLKIHNFLFFLSNAIIIMIFARFLNSQICHPREIREN